MSSEINRAKLILREANKSKLLYAISIIDSIIKSKDSHKIDGDLDRVWRICGYGSKEKFDRITRERLQNCTFRPRWWKTKYCIMLFGRCCQMLRPCK